MESGPLLDPDFLPLAEEFVLFCSIDHDVPGLQQPLPRLRRDLGIVGLPGIAFLDAEGQVLVTISAVLRDVQEMRRGGERARRYVQLRATATSDPAAASAFLIMQLEERQREQQR